MRIDLKETIEFFLNNDNFLLLCHSSPDGDTVGSATALARGLLQKGKNVNVICNDPFTKDFQFMFEGLDFPEFEPEHIVAVDVADPKLLGDEYRYTYGEDVELCIDHHGSNVMYAEMTYLDAESASAAEIIYTILCEIGTEFTPIIASCLFTGVSTDTGCFRYSNTTVRTFEIAARLAEYGADCYNIIQVFFETKTKSYAALERLALESMRFFCNDKFALICVTKDMYAKSGSSEAETTKLASLPRQIEGVLVGGVMREQKDGSFKISLRTHGDIDASAIAQRLGGGGHPGAAACIINAAKQPAINILLKEVAAEIEAFEKERK